MSKAEKDTYKIKGYAFFPEILGNKQTKFDRFTLWLSVKQRVICPNVRDMFTAGGKGKITIDGYKLMDLPKALLKFVENIDPITTEFASTDLDIINDIWHTDFSNKNDLNKEWIDRIIESATTIYDFKTFNFEKWINERLHTAHNTLYSA